MVFPHAAGIVKSEMQLHVRLPVPKENEVYF